MRGLSCYVSGHNAPGWWTQVGRRGFLQELGTGVGAGNVRQVRT